MELLELERKLNERPKSVLTAEGDCAGTIDNSDTDSDIVIMSENMKVRPLEPLKTLPNIRLPFQKPIILKQPTLEPLVVTKVKKIKVR